MGLPNLLWIRRQSANGPSLGSGMCCKGNRLAAGSVGGASSANNAWLAIPAAQKHLTRAYDDIPRGALIYWTGGSHGFGHVATSAGDGWCWSTDVKRSGFFDRIRIEDLNKEWGESSAPGHIHWQGWSAHINEKTVEVKYTKKQRDRGLGVVVPPHLTKEHHKGQK